MLIPFVTSLTTCTPASVSVSYEQETLVSRTIQCSNSDQNSSVAISKTGSFFISDNPTSPILTPFTKTINITFDQNVPVGTLSGSITFSDNSASIPITFIVTEKKPISSISFPSSKRITLPLGDIYDRKVTLIVPSNYPNSITIKSIEFSEENQIVTFGDIETGVVNPGEVKDIPLKINARDAQVGEYPTLSVILRIDDKGQIITLSSALIIVITANINPTSNVTFSTSPSCSLSASVMNLNETYTLTCSNVHKNLQVTPYFDINFFEGKNTQLSGDIYRYDFKPVKFGNTNFIAEFRYLGSPIFFPFKQEVKIQSSGGSVPGTNLELLFTPRIDTAEPNKQIIIQLIDNKTKSLVESPKIYVNAIPLIPFNNSDKSFPFIPQVGINYEIRGEATGYNNLVQTVNITSKELNFSITPEQTIYYTGDSISLFSDVNRTTFLINDAVINTNPYQFSISGNFTIKAVNPDFITATKNVEVKSLVTLGPCSPDFDKWKKGSKIICSLNKNATWSALLDEQVLNSGDGGGVEFTVSDYGNLQVKADDRIVYQRTFEKTSWLEHIKTNWILSTIIGAGIILLAFFYFKNNRRDDTSPYT